MKRFALILALLAMPALAGAACLHDQQQAMSCADGLVWDPETRACIPVASG